MQHVSLSCHRLTQFWCFWDIKSITNEYEIMSVKNSKTLGNLSLLIRNSHHSVHKRVNLSHCVWVCQSNAHWSGSEHLPRTNKLDEALDHWHGKIRGNLRLHSWDLGKYDYCAAPYIPCDYWQRDFRPPLPRSSIRNVHWKVRTVRRNLLSEGLQRWPIVLPRRNGTSSL